MQTAEQFSTKLLSGVVLQPEPLMLEMDGYLLAITSNSKQLLDRLSAYFKHVVSEQNPYTNNSQQPVDEVICIESPVYDAGIQFTDWKREPGKTGRKDAYHDLADARLVLKVRTGMLFLQHETHRLVIGPCNEYDNQVINFINAQYMNWLQQHGALICHASALVINNRAMAIAGFSGGGKSTLMLHMLEDDDIKYLTNDRLFLSHSENGVMATGIPKLPRVNPGTIVNNDRLKPLLSNQRIEELQALPKETLWHLEEKYDVDVTAVYGQGKIVTRQKIDTFLILNWSFDSEESFQINPVDINERSELLNAVMKSPGPFYQFADGTFYQDDMQQNPDDYLDYFSNIRVLEATGRVDFEQARHYCHDYLLSDSK